MVKARDIMTKNVITVQEDTPIDKAVELLAEMGITTGHNQVCAPEKTTGNFGRGKSP